MNVFAIGKGSTEKGRTCQFINVNKGIIAIPMFLENCQLANRVDFFSRMGNITWQIMNRPQKSKFHYQETGVSKKEGFAEKRIPSRKTSILKKGFSMIYNMNLSISIISPFPFPSMKFFQKGSGGIPLAVIRKDRVNKVLDSIARDKAEKPPFPSSFYLLDSPSWVIEKFKDAEEYSFPAKDITKGEEITRVQKRIMEFDELIGLVADPDFDFEDFIEKYAENLEDLDRYSEILEDLLLNSFKVLDSLEKEREILADHLETLIPSQNPRFPSPPEIMNTIQKEIPGNRIFDNISKILGEGEISSKPWIKVSPVKVSSKPSIAKVSGTKVEEVSKVSGLGQKEAIEFIANLEKMFPEKGSKPVTPKFQEKDWIGLYFLKGNPLHPSPWQEKKIEKKYLKIPGIAEFLGSKLIEWVNANLGESLYPKILNIAKRDMRFMRDSSGTINLTGGGGKGRTGGGIGIAGKPGGGIGPGMGQKESLPVYPSGIEGFTPSYIDLANEVVVKFLQGLTEGLYLNEFFSKPFSFLPPGKEEEVSIPAYSGILRSISHRLINHRRNEGNKFQAGEGILENTKGSDSPLVETSSIKSMSQFFETAYSAKGKTGYILTLEDRKFMRSLAFGNSLRKTQKVTGIPVTPERMKRIKAASAMALATA